ncbi:tetratricopeptide repeat protein [Streptomyces laculatispora]|uniref:tetratricopeptide repeat protein n=1 Tax=Streptomyces laculatispora TaxID=887464 RepID=UPI001A9529C8|nr:tetratricopeptide repeat protein [Streptomyces laculatispora]MBO0913161.1 tetratricopeptide repeat protein [Streptomyces laculatispora]
MSPPSSFGDLLSPSGRLRRQWKAALEDPDPHSGLVRLREVRERMEKRPEAAVEMWTDFLRSIVGQPFRQLLTEPDFEALERIGGLVAQAGALPLDQAVRPLATALLGRGEEQRANALLTRLYWAESVQDGARAALADDLARSGQRDVPSLEIYGDLLGRPGPRPPSVVELAIDVLRVDFSSDPVRLRQAAALAAAGLPGADRAAGLYRLLVTADTDAARDHFLDACAADPRDETALLGLLVSYVRDGQAANIPQWAFTAARGAAPEVAAAAELGLVLAWFDADTDVPAPPAGRLVALDLTREAGLWPAYALGRLHLLDGDAARARDLLVPLASDDSSLPQWRYHAAWSHLLSGDHAGLRALTGTVTGSPDDWALARLLLDTGPDAVPGAEAAHAAAAAPPGYERIARVRQDLATGIRPSAGPDRSGSGPGLPAEGGGRPERLEALRTALGEAYGRATGAAGAADMAALVREPLYRRLPRADRLLWSGLLALREEPEEGRRLLGAALALGHERAALVLAAHHLEERRPGRAHRLLAGRSGRKAELLRVWAQEAGGGPDEAVADPLAEVADRRIPQLPYALGAIRLHQLAGEGPLLDPDDAPYHARLAARDLGRALAAGPDALPPDAAELLRAARTVAHGVTPGPAGPSPAVPRHPWAEWVLGLARLAEDPEAVGLGLCGRLIALVDEADEPDPRTVTALAAALARAGMISDDPGRRNALALLVRDLADRHALPEVHALADRVTAAALARPAAGRPPLPAPRPSGTVQPVLALALASGELARGDQGGAVRQLRAAPADSAVCALLADTLDGRPPAAPPPDGSGEQAALLRVIRAAGLVESDPSRCLGLLSAAAPDCDLAAVTDVNRLLPGLLSRSQGKPGSSGKPGRPAAARNRSGQGHPLAGLVKRLTGTGAAGFDPALLAGCATAVGEYELAEEQWMLAYHAAHQGEHDVGPVRVQYARLLCYKAVTARNAQDPLRGAKLLRQAADLLPAAGPAPKGVPSRGRAESLARGLELDVHVGRLLGAVFPGAERERVPWERPGRYAALEAVVQNDAKLLGALRSGGRKGVRRSWEDSVRNREYDVRVHHTLALLYRGMALGEPASAARAGGHLARATVLWTLLLASEEFWEQHGGTPAGPQARTRLRATVCQELFDLHRKLGAEALQAGEKGTARLHLRVLEAARTGEPAVDGLLREFGIPWSVAVDAALWAESSTLAGSVIDAWCAEVIKSAEKTLRDPAAIAKLSDGIDKDYESGIRGLEALIGLGVPLPRLLQTGLHWYNELQNCLYRMGRADENRKVSGKARKFADALAPLCTPGKGYLPANSALGEHFVYRGLYVAQDGRTAAVAYETSLKWDPGNVSAPQLLAEAPFFGALKAGMRNLEAGRHSAALALAREAHELADNDRNRAHALILQGQSHFGSGNRPEALACMRRAMRLDSSSEVARTLYDRYST